MKLTYYDIEICREKGPWQLARLYGDYILVENKKIRREDIKSWKVVFYPRFRYRFVTHAHEVYELRGAPFIAKWFDELYWLRFELSSAFFLLALLLGLWRPGVHLWPVVLLYALFSAAMSYFFHLSLTKGKKGFALFASAYFLVFGLPLAILIPPLVVFFFAAVVIFALFFFVWYKKDFSRRAHPFVPAFFWLMVSLLNHHYLLVLVKSYADFRWQSLHGAQTLVCSAQSCLLEEQIWRVPLGWSLEENRFYKALLVDDLPFFFGFIKKKYLLKIPPEGRYGWLSSAPQYYTGHNLFNFAEEYLKDNQHFYWALYLRSGRRQSENDIIWQSFLFFHPGRMSTEEVLLVYIPALKSPGWLFALPLSQGADHEYYLSLLVKGFLKE
ncbi:MAG: hypothetical protein RML34_09195 [Leptospiraceae bacterium]|nr:hypothetical protein [Leptospiraceae bacterium]